MSLEMSGFDVMIHYPRKMYNTGINGKNPVDYKEKVWGDITEEDLQAAEQRYITVAQTWCVYAAAAVTATTHRRRLRRLGSTSSR